MRGKKTIHNPYLPSPLPILPHIFRANVLIPSYPLNLVPFLHLSLSLFSPHPLFFPASHLTYQQPSLIPVSTAPHPPTPSSAPVLILLSNFTITSESIICRLHTNSLSIARLSSNWLVFKYSVRSHQDIVIRGNGSYKSYSLGLLE